MGCFTAVFCAIVAVVGCDEGLKRERGSIASVFISKETRDGGSMSGSV